MKTKAYISIATLLAAGAAFANAADPVITLTDLTQDVSGDISYTASSGMLSGSGLFGQVSSRYTASTTISINLTALGISSSSASYSGNDALLLNYQTSTSETSGSIGLIATSSGIQFAWQGSLWSSGSGTYASWSDLWADSTNVNGKQLVALTLIGAVFDTSGSKGTFLYDATGAKENGNMGYSSLSTSATYNTIYVNTSYVTAVSVYSGIADADTIKAMSAAVIPEPSAFGLLAGLGALALAGTRRRRRK